MPEPVIQSIPLNQLELSPANVRKTSAGKTAFDELKASIAAHGLLENLIARAIEPGPRGNVRYAVIAGGRRLTALIDLAREGMLAIDYPVPCRVVGDDAPESELSLRSLRRQGPRLARAVLSSRRIPRQFTSRPPKRGCALR